MIYFSKEETKYWKRTSLFAKCWNKTNKVNFVLVQIKSVNEICETAVVKTPWKSRLSKQVAKLDNGEALADLCLDKPLPLRFIRQMYLLDGVYFSKSGNLSEYLSAKSLIDRPLFTFSAKMSILFRNNNMETFFRNLWI